MSETIPEGWSFKKLSDVGKCIRGLTYSPDNVVDNGLLVLRSSNIQNDQISLSDNIYVNIDVEKEFLTQPSDILICVRNGSRHLLGKSAFIDDKLPRATHGAFMTIYRSELNDFFRHHIKSDQFFIQVSRDIGATINSINTGNLLEYKFLTPPLPEQKKIATILTSVDEVIENTQKQIDKLQDLKKATMNELLTKGIGHTEFKDSELGKIPRDWEIYELGQLCIFTQGVQISLDETLRTNREGYIRYLYINDFSSEKNLRFIKDEFPTKIVKDEDLVMANTGHSAGTIFRGKHGVLSNNAFKISIKKYIKSEYLFHFLSTENYWFNIGKLFNTAGQPHVGHGNIAKLQFLCPPLDEQDKIISIIQKIDQNIFNKDRKLSQTQSLKKSLMQDLLTGKVRVQVN